MNKRHRSFTNEEIRDLRLFNSTLHGNLPIETLYRLLATVIEVPGLREQIDLLRDELRDVKDRSRRLTCPKSSAIL